MSAKRIYYLLLILVVGFSSARHHADEHVHQQERGEQKTIGGRQSGKRPDP